MNAYVFPASHAELAHIQLSETEVSYACAVFNGPHAGKFFLDADLAIRDPRYVAFFQPLIADPLNEVELVDLALPDIAPPPLG